MSPELEAHLAGMQAAACRIQCILDAVSALEDIEDPAVSDARLTLITIARQQAREINSNLDCTTLAKVEA